MEDQLVDEGEKIELVNVQTETVIIPDDDTGTKEEKKDQTKDIQVEDVQMTKQQEQEPKRGEEKKSEKEKPVITETVDTQTPLVKDKEKEKEKIEEKKEEEQLKTEPKVTPLSFTSKKKIDDDEDDDALSIQGPINMDALNTTELMEIAIAMKYRAKKKIMKEQQKESHSIQCVVDILSSLLPETHKQTVYID